MKRRVTAILLGCLALGILAIISGSRGHTARGPLYHSPQYLAVTADGATAYVTDPTADAVAVADLQGWTLKGALPLPDPTGVVLSPDGNTLYAAGGKEDKVFAVDLASGKVRGTVGVGRRPVGMALSPDGATLYVCNQFTNDVSVVGTARLEQTARLKVIREPRFAALGAGNTLVVANQLPLGSNLDDSLGAEVSLVNLADGSVTNVKLALGATDVGQVVCSADGKWAYLVHSLSRWLVPPTQLDRGWVNTSALTIIDVPAKKRLATVLLDDLDRGAANPCGLALSPKGDELYVTHAGTNEISLIDVAGLHKMIAERAPDNPVALEDDLTALYRSGARRRVACGGVRPQGIAAIPGAVVCANYFSGDLTKIELTRGKVVGTLPLGEQPPMDEVRKGAMLFSDATICFQGWQSCLSCHPEGRTDGLAWDLLNDGIGNPKHTRSLVASTRTPPVMAHAEREDATVATDAGLKFILFHVPAGDEVKCIVAYMDALEPERSPYRNPDGSLSEAATRGKAIFESKDTACADCHSGPYYTDCNNYDVGTKWKMDNDNFKDFKTLKLVELFRTAPYLHDGSAVTLREVLLDRNRDQWHGHVSQLSPQQMNDLIEYLLSL